MFCENCGMELQGSNQICPNCGIQLKTKKIQFNSNEILFFRDPHAHKIWIWQGSKTNMRDKFLTHLLFLAHGKIKVIRSEFDNDYTIEKVDEGTEPLEFRIMINNADIVYLKRRLRDFKSIINDLDIDYLEKSLKDIKFMIKSTTLKKLTIEKKNLPETFSSELLEISKEDKLPKLKEIVLEYYKYRGLSVKIADNFLKIKIISNQY